MTLSESTYETPESLTLKHKMSVRRRGKRIPARRVMSVKSSNDWRSIWPAARIGAALPLH